MHGRNRDTDVEEDGLMDTTGEGKGGTNRESSIDIYTLSNYDSLLYSRNQHTVKQLCLNF